MFLCYLYSLKWIAFILAAKIQFDSHPPPPCVKYRYLSFKLALQYMPQGERGWGLFLPKSQTLLLVKAMAGQQRLSTCLQLLMVMPSCVTRRSWICWSCANRSPLRVGVESCCARMDTGMETGRSCCNTRGCCFRIWLTLSAWQSGHGVRRDLTLISHVITYYAVQLPVITYYL